MSNEKLENVVRIVPKEHRDTIDALEDLLAQARRGEITGLVWGARYGDWNHGIGVTGFYRRDPITGLGVTGRIFSILNKFIEGGKNSKQGATAGQIADQGGLYEIQADNHRALHPIFRRLRHCK